MTSNGYTPLNSLPNPLYKQLVKHCPISLQYDYYVKFSIPSLPTIGRSQPNAPPETGGRTARIPIILNRQSDSACRTTRPLNGGNGPDTAFDNGEHLPQVIRYVRTD